MLASSLMVSKCNQRLSPCSIHTKIFKSRRNGFAPMKSWASWQQRPADITDTLKWSSSTVTCWNCNSVRRPIQDQDMLSFARMHILMGAATELGRQSVLFIFWCGPTRHLQRFDCRIDQSSIFTHRSMTWPYRQPNARYRERRAMQAITCVQIIPPGFSARCMYVKNGCNTWTRYEYDGPGSDFGAANVIPKFVTILVWIYNIYFYNILMTCDKIFCLLSMAETMQKQNKLIASH